MGGLLGPDEIVGDLRFALVSLSAGVILREGGLTRRFEDIRDLGTVVVRRVSGNRGFFAFGPPADYSTRS